MFYRPTYTEICDRFFRGSVSSFCRQNARVNLTQLQCRPKPKSGALRDRAKLGDTENDLKPNLHQNFWSVGVSVVWFGFGEFRSPRDKRQTLRDRPIEDFSYIWPPGPYNMLTWSSPSICPLDYFDSDRTDMRRRNLGEDHDGGSDPEREIRNRRQKLSFDHERTLRNLAKVQATLTET